MVATAEVMAAAEMMAVEKAMDIWQIQGPMVVLERERDVLPRPKPTQGVAALKQVKLHGFLVRPKPSTEPTAPPTAAMGGAE